MNEWNEMKNEMSWIKNVALITQQKEKLEGQLQMVTSFKSKLTFLISAEHFYTNEFIMTCFYMLNDSRWAYSVEAKDLLRLIWLVQHI